MPLVVFQFLLAGFLCKNTLTTNNWGLRLLNGIDNYSDLTIRSVYVCI